MFYQSQIRFSILLVLGTLYACSSPVQQGLDLGDPAAISQAPKTASVSAGKGVKVLAVPLKQSVELGEPIYLALRVSNEGKEAVNIIGGLQPGEGLIEVFLHHRDGKKKLVAPLTASDFGSVSTLKPSQATGEVFPIFFGSDGWNFSIAGEYRISVELKTPNKKGFLSFSSEPVLIKVNSSKAGKALIAGDKRSSTEAGKYLLWRSGDHLQAGIERLNSISQQYPDSVLSSYISAAHAKNYSEPFANYIVGEVRAAECRRADSYRAKVDSKILPENLLIEDYIAQAKCYAENKNWKEVKRALDTGSELCGNRSEFQRYLQSINKMKKRLDKY